MTTPYMPPGAEAAECVHCGRPIWVLWRNGRPDTTGHVVPEDQWADGIHTSYPKENR